MVELVDYAVSVIPGAELEASFGLFLSKEGRQMLVDKAARCVSITAQCMLLPGALRLTSHRTPPRFVALKRTWSED